MQALILESIRFFSFSQAHVVAAFEQSLASMTSRLQSLTMTAEHKVNFLSRSIEGIVIIKQKYVIDVQENELQDLRQFVSPIKGTGN